MEWKNLQIVFATAFLKHDNGVISRLEASRITQKKIRQINLTTLNEYVSAKSRTTSSLEL